MPAPLISKEEVLERLTIAFRTGGYQGTSLKELSAAAGLPRASLYNYFPGGKEDMARAVLDHVAGWFTAHVVMPLRRDGDPAERLDGMVKQIARFYERGRRSCLTELFGVGDAQPRFQASLRAATMGWEDAIATVLRAAGFDSDTARTRAEGALIRIQGALVIARAKDEPQVFMRTLRALRDDLLAE